MREIIFRGKGLDDEWHYGWLIKQGPYHFIQNNSGGNVAVIETTIGQFTGLLDKNGKRIFEGDIVRWRINGVTETAPVIYDEQCAAFFMGKSMVSRVGLVLNDWMRGEYEVIRTIHDEMVREGK